MGRAELDGDVMLMRHNKAKAAVHDYSYYSTQAQAASQTIKPVSAKCLPIMILMMMIMIMMMMIMIIMMMMMIMIMIMIMIIIIIIIIIIINPFEVANNE